ncbi:MAG TPA: potassium channel family protein [Acidimicrobiales bacterium]|nr:potassium channel family protein [Acidimicrobiales bacterium]
MTVVLVGSGVLLIAAALVDVVWTTVAAGSGAGPITSRLARSLWRLSLAVHARRPSHALLSFSGVAVVLAVLTSWITLALAGWALVFSATDGAVRATTTGVPAGLAGRLYFTGYTVFTLGNGDYVPGDGAWQLATVLAVATGLILVTLSITYLVPVASAVALRRQLATYIASLGGNPHEILVRSWDGTDFGGLTQHLVSLTPLFHTSRQQHLAYPVLHYFHSGDRESAAAPNVVNLSQALHLLRHAVSPDVRPAPATLDPLDRAIGGFLGTVGAAYLAPAPPVPLAELPPLQDAGVPVTTAGEYEKTAAESEGRRSLLASLLTDDGWSV